jgi:alternative ribosome-rescue factor
MAHDHNRGKINHNAMAALVTSPLFKAKTEKPKKGKGSYVRQSFSKKDLNKGLDKGPF